MALSLNSWPGTCIGASSVKDCSSLQRNICLQRNIHSDWMLKWFSLTLRDGSSQVNAVYHDPFGMDLAEKGQNKQTPPQKNNSWPLVLLKRNRQEI